MRAIRLDAYGAASELRLSHQPIPAFGAQDLLIQVAAAGVNPLDWKIRAGVLASQMPRALPFILGWECAGTVVEVGAEVQGFQPGDRVYTYTSVSRGGCYAEYVAVAASEVAHAPLNLDPVVAASLPMTALTAWTLIEAADLAPGQRLLIHGGAGGVGALAIQLAKRQGVEVITTVSKRDLELVQSLGADLALDYRQPEQVSALQPFDRVIDTAGKQAQTLSWPLLKAGGRLLSIVQPPDQAQAQSANVHAAFVSTPPSGQQLAQLTPWFDAGTLKPLSCHAYPLAEAAQVHTLGEAGQLRGRTLLQITD